MVKSNDYLSYLLRLWRAGEDEQEWRAMLQEVSTGETMSFATFNDLCRFLRSELGIRSAPDQIVGSAETGSQRDNV